MYLNKLVKTDSRLIRIVGGTSGGLFGPIVMFAEGAVSIVTEPSAIGHRVLDLRDTLTR